ncbi:hypothetical protein NEFER03_1845 [Nematocida sp. LUAm3]|nr:hypothetical protein NEFER03_1845 [Nematocida sp. LUAm3]KAI5174005.1 hypothetical protein NEFER02_0472 [Nematocida sp. LUAm2]
MKRLSKKILCEEKELPREAPFTPRKPQTPKWLIYRISRYIPMEKYPVRKPEKKTLSIRAKHNMSVKYIRDACKMKVRGIKRIKGDIKSISVHRAEVKETKMFPKLWNILLRAEEVYLCNTDITSYSPCELKASSLDLLGSTAEQVKEKIEELLKRRRRRIRIATKHFVVLWDEYKGCVCAVHSYNPITPLKYLPLIRTLHLINVEITETLTTHMKRHPISYLRVERCSFQQTILFEMIASCKSTLRGIEFHDVSLAPCLIIYLKGLQNVQISIT